MANKKGKNNKKNNAKTKSKPQKPFKTAGGITGSKLGGLFGYSALGERLGKIFGSGLGQLLGSGDYHSNFSEVATNSIVAPKSGDVPTVIGNGTRSVHEIRLRKREYLADVIASSVQGAFSVVSYNINPGDGRTFPWLSSVAQNFEQYRLNGLIFEFKTMSGEYIGTGTTGSSLGSIVMATQYDVSELPFENKFTMENYDMAQSSKPSLSAIHGVECARNESVLSELFVIAPTGVPTGTDAKFFNFGTFSIASVGVPVASTNLGELWVSYDISLFKPKLQPGRLLPGPYTTFSHHHSRVTVASTACNFGTVSLVSVGNVSSTCSSSTLSYTGLNSASLYMVNLSWNGAPGQYLASIPAIATAAGTNIGRFLSGSSVVDGNAAVIAPGNVSGATSNSSFMLSTTMRPDGSGVIALTVSGGTYSGNTVTNFDAFLNLIDASVLQ